MEFEIKCKKCQSTDCSIDAVIDYDWDETPYENGYVIRCHNCGNSEEGIQFRPFNEREEKIR